MVSEKRGSDFRQDLTKFPVSMVLVEKSCMLLLSFFFILKLPF